ncbi:MAG: hypothetical protein K6T75_03845 [Acetobacteraceae bacterium]|nr:hypothetical protein [Acetobacteraceae bacterium]
MWARLRQWLFPREFRIPLPPWTAREVEALEGAMKTLAAARGAVVPPEEERERWRLLGDLATGLWRLGRRLESDEAARRACQRLFESAWDALARGGVEVREHEGEPSPAARPCGSSRFSPSRAWPGSR